MHGILATASEGKHHSILLPELAEVVWSLIILGLLFILVLKLLYPKYQSLTDQRAQKIREGLEMAEQAKEQLAQSDAQAAEEIRQARLEAAKIRDEAQAGAKQILADSRAKAQAEAAQILESANRSIAASRQAAQNTLQAQIGSLATELAERIVGEQLNDTALNDRVIERFLDSLEEEEVKA